MAESSLSASYGRTNREEQHITEDEASLYDRQIRLWGLEAQNRMRSSTVLILSLRSLAHETIKNLVLAGIGRLIVMDDGLVNEEDLGGGFLFREEDGAVGQERTTAALPQISSLNPLVSLTAMPTLAPFVRDPSTSAAAVDTTAEMVSFLQREKVDVVVACDLKPEQMERIDHASRHAGSMFYGAGTYGFYGYVFADLGFEYEYLSKAPSSSSITTSDLVKRVLRYPSLKSVLDQSNWNLPHSASKQGGSPFRDLTRNATKERDVFSVIGILALWEYIKQYGRFPFVPATANTNGVESNGAEHADYDESYAKIALDLKGELGINEKIWPSKQVPEQMTSMLEHLSNHSDRFFAPTLAIVGGLLAQDVLRALSKKDKPIVNLLAVDSMGGNGAVSRWAMADASEA